ncbi:anthranilate synthase component I family protein [Wenyingzhuangia sp. IMCC45533]
MQRINKSFSVHNITQFKQQVLLWGNRHSVVTWLDSNENVNSSIEGFLAVDTLSDLTSSIKDAFKKLEQYINEVNDYAFGFLSYDLKNEVENLSSQNTEELDFPELYFFQPKKLIEISKNKVIFRYPEHLQGDIEKDWQEINDMRFEKNSQNNVRIKNRISESTYVKQVNKALDLIHRGEVYEINFCQEFYGENAVINPAVTYLRLNEISKAPFSTFIKKEHLFLLSASPERFLKKQGDKVISEPIKGTAKREIDAIKDQTQINNLQNSTKEIAENIMIVDLVRNDLSHIAQPGSVKVDELCKIYSFKQVHQMISSISCFAKPNIHPVNIIKACYPMGSMTGAPKIAAMSIIEELEISKRGLYSGAVGYFTPDKNFDFNVVIRSILYNRQKKYVSFSVGSAITAKADARAEYQECLLKAKAMRKVLTQ